MGHALDAKQGGAVAVVGAVTFKWAARCFTALRGIIFQGRNSLGYWILVGAAAGRWATAGRWAACFLHLSPLRERPRGLGT